MTHNEARTLDNPKVDVEIRTLNTTWLEVAERLLSSPNDASEAP